MIDEILKLLKDPIIRGAIYGSIITVILTLILKWAGRKIKKLFLSLWYLVTGRRREKRFEKEYLDALIEDHQFLGLIPTTKVVPQKSGLRLTDLEQVYTSLSLADENDSSETVINDEERFNGEKRLFKRWRFSRRRQRLPEEYELGKLIAQHERLLIKGDPGSGKTTLLRYLAVSCARALRADRKEGDDKQILKKRLGWRRRPFPIFISLINLQTWNPDKPLCHAFEAQLKSALREHCPENFFEKKLRKGHCIILLDAFDELGNKRARHIIARKTGTLAGLYKNKGHKFIATARPVGYEGQLEAYGFSNYVVQALDAAARTRLVRQRYLAIAIDESEGKTPKKRQAIEQHYRTRANDLLQRVKQNPHLEQLTHNPLLLTLIVMIAAADIVIPEQRHALYRECVDVMADSWGRDKQEKALLPAESEPEIIQRDEKIKLLAALAIEMQYKRESPDKPSLISRSQVQNIIIEKFKTEFNIRIPENESRPERFHLKVARGLLDNIRVQSGILIEKGFEPQSGEPLVAFSHFSFQEYLAAFYVKENQAQRALNENLMHPAWREVVKLYRAMTGDGQIIRMMLSDKYSQPDGLLLAATCMTEYAAGIDTRLQRRIKRDLFENVTRFTGEKQAQFLAAIAGIGGTENLELLLGLLKTRDEKFALRIFKTLGELNLAPNDRSTLAEKLLKLLEKPDTLTFKMKVAVGQAVEHLGDPRFEAVDPPMMLIPAGEFLYGEKCKKMILPAFEISIHPITNSAYKRFVAATGHRSPDNWKEGFYPQGKANHPVVTVDWYDAQAFCRWLTQAGDSSKTYRLPAEQEWEKAARGTDGREFPWGNRFDKKKCNSYQQIEDTSPVGIFKDGASPFGILDAAGNVWEWTDSRWSFVENLKWRVPGLRKSAWTVFRGGSWLNNNENDFRCANRSRYNPHYRYFNVGFRVVRSAQF